MLILNIKSYKNVINEDFQLCSLDDFSNKFKTNTYSCCYLVFLLSYLKSLFYSNKSSSKKAWFKCDSRGYTDMTSRNNIIKQLSPKNDTDKHTARKLIEFGFWFLPRFERFSIFSLFSFYLFIFRLPFFFMVLVLRVRYLLTVNTDLNLENVDDSIRIHILLAKLLPKISQKGIVYHSKLLQLKDNKIGEADF